MLPEDFIGNAERPELLEALMEEYVLSCHAAESEGKKGKKEQGRFPNLAGFCRYCGIGRSTIRRLRQKEPELWERMEVILEDEALNAELSPTLISAYLKKRLDYEEEEKNAGSFEQLRVVFDHDAMKDGE